MTNNSIIQETNLYGLTRKSVVATPCDPMSIKMIAAFLGAVSFV